MKGSVLHSKGILSTLLLTVTLCVGLFTFSASSHTCATKPAQTEQVFSNKHKSSLPTTPFASHSLLAFSKNKLVTSSLGTDVVQYYNRCVQLRFNRLSRPLYFSYHPGRFLQSKSIPQSSCEDAHSAIG